MLWNGNTFVFKSPLIIVKADGWEFHEIDGGRVRIWATVETLIMLRVR
jgi:hypothetical protein